MAIKLSVGLRNFLVLCSVRPGFLHLYTGGQPPGVEFPPTGRRVSPSITMTRGVPSAGSISLTSGGVSLATGAGLVGWGRLVDVYCATDTEDRAAIASNDFTVGPPGSGADLILDDPAINTGDPITVSLTVSLAAS